MNRFAWLTASAGYAIAHNLTPFISMQNHHSLLYREEEREMLPLLKVSLNSLRVDDWSRLLKRSNLVKSPASRCRVHPLESVGKRRTHSPMGRDQHAGDDGYVSIQFSAGRSRA